MQPDLIVGFDHNNSNLFRHLTQKWFKSNVQWRLTEQLHLEKEWIKFFACCLDQGKLIFSKSKRIQYYFGFKKNKTNNA
jgi:hypothetical protein